MKKDISLLYLTINETLSEHGGVSNKLFNKVTALREEVKICNYLNAKILIDKDGLTEKNIKAGFKEIQIGVKKANKGYLNKVNSDILFYETLSSFLIDQDYKFDKIICRYPLASFGLLKFSKKFKNKIVFEHNAFELAEVRLHLQNKKSIKFSLRPSLFFYWLQEIELPVFAEKRLSKRIYLNAHSGACVTSAIAEYEKKICPSYKTFVSSNFYQVSLVNYRSVKWNYDNELLSLGFIVTNFAPWYGVERLLRSFSKVQLKYKLYLAGIDPDDAYLKKLLKNNNITSNFYCAGKLDQQELATFYHDIHLTFGSLAIYKSDSTFASTLKVKESIAYGRPVVLAYFEEDFYNNEEFKPYYLQFPNDDSDLDFEKIEDFAKTFYSDMGNQKKLHDLALKYMDASVKMKTLVENISAI